MSIYRSGDFSHISRIQRVEGDPSEDHSDPKKRKKVLYNGRLWSESDEDLPIDSAMLNPPKDKELVRGNSQIYADKMILEQAKKLLEKFTTLEEKIASFCFLIAEANYSSSTQEELEYAVLKHQIAGVLFTKGDFKRQSYLIDYLKGLTKCPLLFGNDFFHGLSFYFEGELPTDTLEVMDEKQFADLGKAVASQNRHLGVHFQFDRPLVEDKQIKISDKHSVAFRKGIRDAKGVVGKEKKETGKTTYSQSSKKVTSFKPSYISLLNNGVTLSNNSLTSFFSEQIISETMGLRTIEFSNFPVLPQNISLEKWVLDLFSKSFDGLLCSYSSLNQIVEIISRLVDEGEISREEIDKKVFRILLFKLLLLH